MNIQDFIYGKQMKSIKDLIPLNDINNEEDKKKHEGYFIGFTRNEFQERFSYIDSSKVFYQKDLFSSICYMNKEKMLYRNLPLYPDNSQGEIKWTTMEIEDSEEETLKLFIKVNEEMFDKGEYTTLLNNCPHQIAFEMFKDSIDILPKEIVFNLFNELYNISDFGFSTLDCNTIKKIYGLMPIKEKENINKLIKDWPEEINIYRGQGDKSTPTDKAFSWSVSEDVAYRFATMRSPKSSEVIYGKVYKKDILNYTNRRNEEEVIVLPENVRDVHKIELQGVKSLSQEDMDCYLGNMENYKYDFEKYYYDVDSYTDHDKEHSLRVSILAQVLVYKYLDLQLDEDDLQLLVSAAMFHDIGRDINEQGICLKHGLYSYEKLINDDIIEENEELKFLLEYHCKDDELAEKHLDNLNITNNRKLVLLDLYRVLKDSDALDRVRFGFGRDRVNIDYLRFAESKQVIFIAEQLLKCNIIL